MLRLSLEQARRFLLLKQGLLGDHRFIGKAGALSYVRQSGCIQFDPVDACGKNAELALQSRVKGFAKRDLYDLLYTDRQLVDYPDKNLSIIPVESWPYFERYRQAARESGKQFDGLDVLQKQALAYIDEHGAVSSAELPITGSTYWHSAIHWSGNWSGSSNAARSVLEQLYSTGQLVIHHKEGARKYYDLAVKHLPAQLLGAPDPLPEDEAHMAWRVLRRIGAIGLLWNRPSDAWLNIWGMKAAQRDAAFSALLSSERIVPLQVDGLKDALYCRSEDIPLMEAASQQTQWKPRCELLAPLDCMLWDRRLINALFGFDYTWEIYTPAAKRKYGYYVLPMLYSDNLVGRVEATADRKAGMLTVKNIWLESGVRPTKKLQTAIGGCLKRFAKFNDCRELSDIPPLSGG